MNDTELVVTTETDKGLPEYALDSRFSDGERHVQAIAIDEFVALREARLFLLEYLQFEETFRQFLFSYEEFETLILQSALRHHLFSWSEYEATQDARLRFNLKTLGFLNSLTSLRDQFPKFKQLRATVDVRARFIELWQTQKDGSTAFSFCERLRNFAQHQTQPVTMVKRGTSVAHDRGTLEDFALIYVDVQSVCTNRDILAGERQKYEAAFGENCEIGLIFRETVSCIGRIVAEVKTMLKSQFASCMATYQRNLDAARKGRSGFIVAYAVSEQSTDSVEKFAVFEDFSERLTKLHHAYVSPHNQAHVISNASRGHGG
jgi:hypothetical protein